MGAAWVINLAVAEWIIRRHLIPNNASHIIVVGTLAIPGMILVETALS